MFLIILLKYYRVYLCLELWQSSSVRTVKFPLLVQVYFPSFGEFIKLYPYYEHARNSLELDFFRSRLLKSNAPVLSQPLL